MKQKAYFHNLFAENMDCFQAMRETHELREEVRKLQRVCGLKNNEIEQEVNLRIAVSIDRTTKWNAGKNQLHKKKDWIYLYSGI